MAVRTEISGYSRGAGPGRIHGLPIRSSESAQPVENLWIIVPPGIAAVWAIWTYNRLVTRRNRVASAWADIDVQLTRRHELVPELVATVRAYTDHERDLLESVTALRAEALFTESPALLAGLEESLHERLTRLFAVIEDYPDLKADRSFRQLHHALVETEDRIQYARRYYNGAVRELNNRIQQFPDLLVARPAGFREAEFYAADAEQRTPPPVPMSRAQ